MFLVKYLSELFSKTKADVLYNSYGVVCRPHVVTVDVANTMLFGQFSSESSGETKADNVCCNVAFILLCVGLTL